jgi:hypothetical protein
MMALSPFFDETNLISSALILLVGTLFGTFNLEY